ncbi:hypothetical protein JCM1841_000854 [Sporobolomyces salmonicolor]
MEAPSQQQNACLAHLLARLNNDLEFLHSQQLLDKGDLDLIKSKLASASRRGSGRGVEDGMARMNLGAAGAGEAATGLPQREASGSGVAPLMGAGAGPSGQQQQGKPGQGKQLCKAVWDYNKTQPDDLGFKQGDIITIEEEVNGDWWKGSLNGQTGLFPCNHVERIESAEPVRAPPPPPPSQGYNPSYNSFTPPPPSYGAPPAPAGPPEFAYQTPQGYGAPPPGNTYNQYGGGEKQSYAPPPPPPQVLVQQQPPQVVVEEQKKHKFGGKFGRQMGTAFAGGIGFGAGSALASDAINSIF